jgi:hypothetical protein
MEDATHWDTIKHIAKYMNLRDPYDISEEGYITNHGKWFGHHFSSYVLWDLHLSDGGTENTWSHDGLGYWVHITLSEGECSAFELSPEKPIIEIRERDDGFMEVQYFATEEERAKQAAYLDELCHSENEANAETSTAEDEDTEPEADNDSSI